jgi:regulator of replication initiation timing
MSKTNNSLGHWCDYCQCYHSSASCFNPARKMIAEVETERDALHKQLDDAKVTIVALLAESEVLQDDNDFLRKQLDEYEEEASCGHPEKYWKVEPDNATAWCVMCALNDAMKNIEHLKLLSERDNNYYEYIRKQLHDEEKANFDYRVRQITLQLNLMEQTDALHKQLDELKSLGVGTYFKNENDTLRKQLDIAVKQLQRIRDSSLTKASIPYHLAYTALVEIERIGEEK